MDESLRAPLDRIGSEQGTPCYVYFLDVVRSRMAALRQAFAGRFLVSYAVKANPNVELLRSLSPSLDVLDVSSAAELDRALAAGYRAGQVSFSGPGKRRWELERAVHLGCGEIVCESLAEIRALDEIAGSSGRRPAFLMRINPLRMPRKFGVNMAGRASQFGIDEEELDAVLRRRDEWEHLEWRGFHIYSGSNCLDAEAVAENFKIFIELFARFADGHDLHPRRLIFGSGFGIPYLPGDKELDLARLASLINPEIDELRRHPRLQGAECVLELGRWLVGPAGYLVTSVIGSKSSRGTEIRICDAGFNNHLAACGMMGTVIRRNWRFEKLNTSGSSAAPDRKYLLVGPLCTTIDQLGVDVALPELEVGDRLAICASGAYGLTASPTRFISHPEPCEYLVAGNGRDAEVVDITESRMNEPVAVEHFTA